MGIQAQKLRGLLNSGEPFIAAEAYSALTGRIVEKVGFKAAYLGGHACSAFHYAIPDNGIFTQVEQIEQSARIAAAIDIPLIADADTLGETIADAFRFTRLYEQAGIAGYHVEDEVNPKHMNYDNGLLPITEMQAKIEACVKARQDPAFVIIARCDELYASKNGGGGTGNLDEAIKRGLAYADAGADAYWFPMASPEAVAALCKALPVPVFDSYAGGPAAAVLSTGWGWTGAAQLHFQRARELMETGAIAFDGKIEDKAGLLGEPDFEEVIKDWAEKTGRPLRTRTMLF